MSSSASTPSTRPRRELRSPMMSPTYSDGALMSTCMIGSSSVARLGDRFAIRHFRRMEDHVDAVLLVQLRDDDLDVQLPSSGKEELLRLRIAGKADGWIFFDDAPDRHAELVLIAARFRFHGKG